MAKATIKFTEFVDQLLVRLYDLDAESPGEFHNLSAIAESLKTDVPAEWVFDAGKVLESRALADVLFTFGGTDAKISGEGRLYVEEGRGTTKDIQDNPQNYYVTVSGNNNQVITGSTTQAVAQTITIEQERAPAFAIVDQILRKLAEDPTLPGAQRQESLTYANLIKLELAKPEPNRNLIAAVLDPLSKVASIAGAVASLVRLFNSAA
jgi:hypothetical protein